jgi:hypothetical protein
MMRRFDGGNNGEIEFGGGDGGWAGFAAATTRRALAGIERAGFIVETAAAVAAQKKSRQWRLTMYKADGKFATKDFMRTVQAAETPLQDAPDRFRGEREIPENVSMMSARSASDLPPESASPLPKQGQDEDFREEMPLYDALTCETIRADLALTGEIHIETTPCGSSGSVADPVFGRQHVPALSLLADLPLAPSPHEQLCASLREIVRRRRGIQSRLAEALGVSRQKMANALAGREKFTPTAEATLRRWVSGAPISAAWPPLPRPEEGQAA